jgi:hypothetical protein
VRDAVHVPHRDEYGADQDTGSNGATLDDGPRDAERRREHDHYCSFRASGTLTTDGAAVR